MTTSTQPVNVPGATDQTARPRSHTIGSTYPRQDADGNAVHVHPESTASVSRSPITASTSGSSILGLLGLSPRSGTQPRTLPLAPPSTSSSVSGAEDEHEAVTPPQHPHSQLQEASHDDHELDDNFDDLFAARYNLHRVKSNQVASGKKEVNGLQRSVTMDPTTHSSSSHNRRASWSPVNTADSGNTHSSTSVFGWLNGQARENNGTARESGFKEGNSPVGIFRRLSLSTKGRIPIANSQSSHGSQIVDSASGFEETGRGRSSSKSKNGPRKLSPMGERMLRAHYDTFS